MTVLLPLGAASKGKLRVVGFMSGSGTNLEKILESQQQPDCPYEVVVIFTDNQQSRAQEISKKSNIPYRENDINQFYQKYQRPRSDMHVRELFDLQTCHLLQPFQPQVIAYAGYMSKASKILVESYTGVNVHPADLRLRKKGKPLYTGTHAVRKALQTGEKELRSTTHFVSEAVDCGQIFIVSAPLPVDYSEVEKIGIEQAASIYQNRLKEHGDWKIFPKTLKALAQGRFCIDFSGNLYYDGRPVPDGIEYH